jgi:hypothetical protein
VRQLAACARENGSKIFARSSGAIPTPVSVTLPCKSATAMRSPIRGRASSFQRPWPNVGLPEETIDIGTILWHFVR